MPAQTLLIIRHGEKPQEVWPGPGLTADGTADRDSLVIRGWQRSGAWAALFATDLGGESFPRPNAVYAADPTDTVAVAGDDDGPSQRPYETVLPLSARLGVAPVTRWSQNQEAQLAAEVATLAGVTLICWEHKRIISGILPALLGTGDDAIPGKWNGDRFDVVLRLDRLGEGRPWSLRQLFPQLLSGDSNTPLG